MAQESNAPSFSGLGIAPKLEQIVSSLGFTTPTPIQHQAIPAALEGNDVVGIAQTGTGKTLAFGIPMIQRLARTRGRGLILLPTRELALQVDETLRVVGGKANLRTAVLIGGANMNNQIRDLRRLPHIIVATPGRLIDHLEQKTLSLAQVNTLVLDEADRMLDMGFAPQISRILAAVPRERQTMLFSATMPSSIVQIAAQHMRQPVRIEVAPAGTTVEQVEQEVYIVRKETKLRLLAALLEKYHGSVLVFSRTKHGAKRIAAAVRAMGHSGAEIHANRSLPQRREALDGFKAGKYRVLVATDIAARGIDVTGIELVLNFDLPQAPEDYVHRIGRTARAGRTGYAVSFATPDQAGDLRQIERLIRTQISVSTLPADLPPSTWQAIPMPDRFERGERGGRGGRRYPERGQRPSAGGQRQAEGSGRRRSRGRRGGQRLSERPERPQSSDARPDVSHQTAAPQQSPGSLQLEEITIGPKVWRKR